MNDRLVQMALVVSCVCLLAANALTWAAITHTNGAAAEAAKIAVAPPARPAPARPAAAPAGPVEVPAETPAATAEPAGAG